MLQSVDKKNRILLFIIIYILLSTISNKTLENKKEFLTKVNKINVSGLSNDNNLKLEKKLNRLLFKNIFFINENDFGDIISKNNLVERYSIKKIYPSQINIKIKQTKFVATISNNKKFLVGANGKLIKNEYANEMLPFFFGEFDSKIFLEFKKNVEKSKFNLQDFKSIKFNSSNRWDILTKSDILIKLPKQKIPEALRMAYKIMKEDKFKDNLVIDLRASSLIFVK